MDLIEAIEGLKSRWGKEKNQRQYAENLLCIYDGDWTDLIKAKLQTRFSPETYKHLRVEVDPTINMVQRVVHLVAAIYTEEAERLVGDIEPEQYTREGLIDDLLDEADRMVFLCRNVLLHPYSVEGGLDLDVITPDRFTVLRTKGRRSEIDAAMFFVPDEKKYVVWTPEEHCVLDSGFNVDYDFGVQPNDYGRIPLIPIFEQEPVRHWWQVKMAETLYQLALNTASAIADLMHGIKLASYKKLVIKLGKGGKLETSPDQNMDVVYPLIIEGDGDVAVADITVDHEKLLDTIFKKAGAPLAQWGLRTDMIRQGGLDATSGYHLRLQMAGLLKQHRRRAKRWRTRESRIYQLGATIIDVDRRRSEYSDYGLMPLPTGDLQVNHGDLGPEDNPVEKAAYWEKMVQNGFAERVDAIADLHKLSREQAEEKLARINAESASRVAATTFGAGMDALNPTEEESGGLSSVASNATATPGIPGGDV